MSKFKVGDRIRRVGMDIPWTPLGYETVVLPGYRRVDKNGSETVIFDDNWELVTPAGPVREITRKEIVPGAYGPVTVVDSALERVSLSFDQGTTHYLFTPPELREAANVFNQLADALEDGA